MWIDIADLHIFATVSTTTMLIDFESIRHAVILIYIPNDANKVIDLTTFDGKVFSTF